ncbi:MAG: glycoside hydrolase family 127 protein [Bacteroidetes bacterium]|nr:glycoside hydrolase family 127 protein [Bacteroidota bacterium]
MRIILFSIVIATITSCSDSGQDNLKTLVMGLPDTLKQNVNYIGNQQPLKASPLIKLPTGAISPRGWLKEMMLRQSEGLTGNLGKISAWLQKKDNAWLNPEGKGNWGWEEVPYWLKGYISMAYILKKDSMIRESELWIKGVMNSQRSDGNFGPTFLDKEGREDFWPKMIMLYCLQTYYEATQDKKVIEFMTRFFQYQMQYDDEKFLRGHYWQGVRTGDNLHSVIWLYNQTQDTSLLKLMHKIHRNSNSWANRNAVEKQKNHIPLPGQTWPAWYNQLTDWHNVNVAQGFREPGTYYQVSKDQKDLQSSYETFTIIRDYFGQVPGGMFGGDEVSRPGFGDPRQAIETCGIVEQMNSDEHLLRITGDLFWADHVEEVAFNTYPAAVMPDFRSLRYLTSPNMVQNDDKDHAPGIFNNGPYLMMNPFSSRCCQHNHTQGWPYFTENLWMATPDNGIAAVIYSASEVKFKAGENEFSISEETNYPFEDTIRLKLSAKKSGAFPLYLRIPGWCEQAVVLVNGKPINAIPTPSLFVKLEKKWRDGDIITIVFPMKPRIQIWSRNKNSVSAHYGPLTFSLKIGEQYVRKESDKTAQYDSKWQPGVDTKAWPSFEIYPTTPWNYGLDINLSEPEKALRVFRKPWPLDDFPFTAENAPLFIETTGRIIPEWTLDQYGLCAPLQDSPAKTMESLDTITLIPMGAARLRISAFPQVGDPFISVQWKPTKP